MWRFRLLGKLFKGTYDVLSIYLLGWVLLLALIAFGFHALAELVAESMDFGDQEFMWKRAAQGVGVSPLAVRLPFFLFAHALFLFLFRRPIGALKRGLERAFRFFEGKADDMTATRPRTRVALEFLFTVVTTTLLVPFVLQPTLVTFPGQWGDWGQRAANLIDGTASDAFAESVVAGYRWAFTDGPEMGRHQVTAAEYNRSLALRRDPKAPLAPQGPQPLMDRWNRYIWDAVDGNPELFAKTKAFMWVESAGRQFAVSTTGCAGLMQFCVGTARRKPFKSIFGVGQVFPCGCAGTRCRIPRDVKRALESDPGAIKRHRSAFPCVMGDARFDPQKSIAAGVAYVKELSAAHGGNIYLMYIGYNSGPAVSRAVWKKLGRNRRASLREIETHLTGAMRPYYGRNASSRARSLVYTHLPKIRGALDRYRKEAGTGPPANDPKRDEPKAPKRPPKKATTPKAQKRPSRVRSGAATKKGRKGAARPSAQRTGKTSAAAPKRPDAAVETPPASPLYDEDLPEPVTTPKKK